MKNQKYILHSVAVLAVAALATACSSEDELTDKTSGNKETVTITAYQPNTRVGFDKNGDGYWQEGDTIGVIPSSGNLFTSFSIASGAGTGKATFTGTVTGGVGNYAVYPYNYYHYLAKNTLYYYLPSSYTYTKVDQDYSEKNGNSFCMPMYGTVANNEVSFKHLGGVICLKIDKMPAESGTVKITEASNQLCGMFTANLTDDAPKIKPDQSEYDYNRAVTLIYSGATANAAGVFYLPVATGSYNLAIQVYDGSKVSTTNTTVDVKRSCLKVVNIKTDYTDRSRTINGHNFIDLGLLSGLLWAETNIGAETAADDGDYFAWGEIKTKDTYDWSTYNYGSSSSDLTKYTSSDNKTVLESSDDAAYQNWDSSCRMPTRADFEELCITEQYTCTWTWTSKTNSSNETINGYEVTSKKNGNSIFLPASGYRYKDRLSDHGSDGYYWSGTLNVSDVSYACDLLFSSDNVRIYDYGSRYCGRSVRPVAEP